MQQRLTILGLAWALKEDPFYGEDQLVFDMNLCLRRQLLQAPMTFKFIGTPTDLDEHFPGSGHSEIQRSIPYQDQLELIHTWCGLARLDTYRPRDDRSTGWFGWEYEERCHLDLEIDRDDLKKFLRNWKLPLPAFWFPQDPDNSQRKMALGEPDSELAWDNLVLLGEIQDEISAWKNTAASSVTERVEGARQLCRLQRERMAVLSHLTGRRDSFNASLTASGGIGEPNSLSHHPAEAASSPFVFRSEGDFWNIVYDGKRIPPLKNCLGLRYIAFLLGSPHQDIHVMELSHTVNGHQHGWSGVPIGVINQDQLMADGLSLSRMGDAGVVLDARAKADYRKRIRDIQEELEEAQAFSDLPKISKLQEELEYIEKELATVVGLAGKDRKAADTKERIRKAVTNRIRGSLKKLERAYPPLGHHLSNAIKTGTFCSYCPEESIPWSL